jgi:hypothetical protein
LRMCFTPALRKQTGWSFEAIHDMHNRYMKFTYTPHEGERTPKAGVELPALKTTATLKVTPIPATKKEAVK